MSRRLIDGRISSGQRPFATVIVLQNSFPTPLPLRLSSQKAKYAGEQDLVEKRPRSYFLLASGRNARRQP